MSNSEADRPGTQPSGALFAEQRTISGLKDYETAIDRVVAMALGRIRIFDRRLAAEYNAAPRIDAMRAFLLANRSNRVSIVVHESERIRADCPRLVSLQRHFPVGISIHRTLSLARNVYDPFCVADGSHYARRFHFDSMRGSLVFNDADGAAELVRRFEEIWEVSRPAITATTLGL